MFNVSPKSATSPAWQAYDDISEHIANGRVLLSEDELQSYSSEYREQYGRNRCQWYLNGKYSDPEGNYA
jgi:hypothetical protein